MKKLFLFRHSLTLANEEGKYCGALDLHLSQKGRDLLLKKKETALFPNIAQAKVYSSPLIRVQETLRLLYPDLEYSIIPELKEMSFGIFENHSYEELKNNVDYQKWISGCNKKNICPKGESGALMEERVLKSFKHLLPMLEMNDLALFSHGGPIAAIMHFLFPKENKNLYQWQPDFACGWKVDIQGGTFESF